MLFNVWLLPGTLVLFAGQTAAGPSYRREPYQPQVARMSVRNILGLQSRQDGGAYNPDQQFCGNGDTCSEACGDGFAKARTEKTDLVWQGME